MTEYRHPRALDEVDGHPPEQVSLNRHTYDVDSEGVFATDDRTSVRQLAEAYDVTVDDLRVGSGDESDSEATGGDEDRCQTVKDDGEVCGRELPCQYHSEDGDD